ncbi:hypothetical protein GEV33_002359 [Tenebrio molitor]|uniref:Uncharacterized protein n=1 Tax=Tenebrio molitor TaxID=7067 RepID=A0A8J6LIX3_TENMO|nr:hypothetical protein GEV33_002359 [Tenebrio molitor]
MGFRVKENPVLNNGLPDVVDVTGVREEISQRIAKHQAEEKRHFDSRRREAPTYDIGDLVMTTVIANPPSGHSQKLIAEMARSLPGDSSYRTRPLRNKRHTGQRAVENAISTCSRGGMHETLDYVRDGLMELGVLRHQFRAQSEDAHTSGRAVSAKSRPNVNHGIGITETQYERRGQTRKSGKGFQHREKEAQLGFSTWMKLVLCAVPVQMEDENNSNSVDPTSAVATGGGNTTEDKTARSSLTILLRASRHLPLLSAVPGFPENAHDNTASPDMKVSSLFPAAWGPEMSSPSQVLWGPEIRHLTPTGLPCDLNH